MGTLTDIHRGDALLEPSLALHGLEVVAIASRLFQDGDSHGFSETLAALGLLLKREQQQGLFAAVWYILDVAGWLGNFSHCWHCGREEEQAMFWQRGQLVCDACGRGMKVSAGLRKSVAGMMSGGNVRFSDTDSRLWREMIRQVLQEHGIRATDSFRNDRGGL